MDRPSTHQSERAQDAEALDAAEHEFDETENNDDDVEAVPLVLHVLDRVQRNDLEHSFRGEDCGEDLRTRTHTRRLTYSTTFESSHVTVW